MDERQNARFLILALSVLLMGGAYVVARVHDGATDAANAASTVAKVEPVVVPPQFGPGKPTNGRPSEGIFQTTTPVPATTLDQAKADARQGAGEIDPMAPIGDAPVSLADRSGGGKKADPRFAVPPPPVAMQLDQDGNPISSQAPPPAVAVMPQKVSESVRVVGLMDDKAIIVIPKSVCREHNLHRTVMTIGAGDQVGDMKVVAVTKDGVTVSEDGEKQTKRLNDVR
jgi:hypothetical protein